MFWGLSESLDLYQEYLNALKGKSADIDTMDNQITTDSKANSEQQISDGQPDTNAHSEGDTKIQTAHNDNDIIVSAEEPVAAAVESEIESNKITSDNADYAVNSPPSNNIDTIEGDVATPTSPADIGAGDGAAGDWHPPTIQLPAEIGAGDATTHSPEPARNLKMLILGAGDPRHLIRTLAKLYTHKGRDGQSVSIHIYVLEGCVEIVARTLTLLGIALESPDSFNLLNKVHLFMDVYGNSLLRPSSHQYLVGKTKTLLKMVTNDELLQKLAPMLDIAGLKYRERDGLENALNFLLPKEGHVFDVQSYWTSRLRNIMGMRYDYREGAFDWDLNMILKERNGNQICSQEYRYWRETGIAFTYPEYEQCKPNKTLSVGLVRNGEKYMHRGYAGDIQTGPFCAFGLKSSDERMLKSMHGENDYRATDITERNLLEYFHELHTRSPYVHNTEVSRKYGAVKLLMGNCLSYNECDIDAMQEYDKPWIQVDGVKVHFLSADDVFALQDENGRWQDFFDLAFVGHNYFIFLKDSFSKVLRENALLILETKLMTMARKDELTAFEEKLKNYAKRCQMTPVVNYNALNTKNSLLKFKKTSA